MTAVWQQLSAPWHVCLFMRRGAALVGAPASGKSTLARQLAQQLGIPPW